MSLSNILKIFLIFRDLSLTDSYKIYSYKKKSVYLIQYFLLPMTELLLQNEWLLTLGEIEPQKLLLLLAVKPTTFTGGLEKE